MLKALLVCVVLLEVSLIAVAELANRNFDRLDEYDSSTTQTYTKPTATELEDSTEEGSRKRNESLSNESVEDDHTDNFKTTPLAAELFNDGREPITNQTNVCKPPPDIDGTISPESDKQLSEYSVGSTVYYQCDYGYVSRSSSGILSICDINDSTGEAEWTRPTIECIPRSCGDPGYISNGRRIGHLFTFPNKVEYECQEGYKLRGLRARYCQAGGDWSGRLPACEQMYCSVPPDPINGRALYSSLEYGSELNYECNKGFMLQNQTRRLCTEHGTWSNNEPECIETRCKSPESPEHGSVQLIGDLKVGSLAVYSCDDGTILIGTSTSRCLVTGDWTFDPPKCTRPCAISVIQNGKLGRYETRYYRGNPRQDFVAFQIGENVHHDETVILMCDYGFSTGVQSGSRTDEVICSDGTWSKPLQCHTHSCLGDPPPIENGTPVVKSNSHGKGIWYKCDFGYGKEKTGDVKCNYGRWEGPTPVCGDFRCYTNQLNYPGLVKPAGDFVMHEEKFDIQCERGYEKSGRRKIMTCAKGKWSLQSNPCEIKTCANDPPSIRNGKPRVFTRVHGSTVDYECDEGFERTGLSSVLCELGKWEGHPPVCTTTLIKNPLAASIAIASRNSTTELVAPSSSSPDAEECFCTYDYRTDLLKAFVGNTLLEGEARIKKGEKITLDCKLTNMDLVWPNGLRFRQNISLTCNGCEVWHMNHLPYCDNRLTGDSYILYDTKMKFLPSGGLEVPQSGDITIQCRSTWQQPNWNNEHVPGVKIYWNSAQSFQSTGYFAAHLVVKDLTAEHSRSYGCGISDHYRSYRSTYVDLKVKVLCPELATVTNSGIFTISYENNRRVNTRAYYQCEDSSKRLSGQNERVCLENGKWSGSYPACEDSDGVCSLLDEGNIFSITYSNERKLHSIAYYRCKNSKQKVIGSSNRTCLHTGQWSGIDPSCEDITCFEFPTYNGISVSYSEGTKVNSIATFECTHPAVLVGSQSSRCQPNGLWSDAKPSCEIVEMLCPKLDGKDIFTIQYSDNRRINSTASFFCKGSNQKVSGCNFMTCHQNGEWLGEYPTCVDYVTCSKFSDSPGLEVTYSQDTRVGSIATFSCIPPSILEGRRFSTCLYDGVWSNPFPSCKGKDCSIEELVRSLPRGVIPDMSSVTSEFVTPDTEIRLECEDSWIFLGNSKAKCSFQGTWDHGNVQCVPGCRVNVDASSVLKMEPMKQYYRVGESIELSCPFGHKLTSETQKVMCFGKTWSDKIPDCEELKETSTSGFRRSTKNS